jgi:hypothetical protein
MQTFFNGAPFARFELGRHVLSQQTAFSITDYLSKIGLTPADIDKVQDPKFREEYKAEYQKCKDKGLDSGEGIACLGILAAKVYAQLKMEENKPVQTAVPMQQPKPSEFPWIPVAIGGVAAVGLVYFLATRGK